MAARSIAARGRGSVSTWNGYTLAVGSSQMRTTELAVAFESKKEGGTAMGIWLRRWIR